MAITRTPASSGTVDRISVDLRSGPLTLSVLPGRLPEQSRVAWVSERAREVWEERIGLVKRAWFEIEKLSVQEQVRECCLTVCAPQLYLRECERARDMDLFVIAVDATRASSQGYSSRADAPRDGEPFQFRTVLGRPKALSRFREAWREGDNGTIGELLGFPACCRSFFDRVWVDAQLLDTCWAMAANSPHAYESNGSEEIRTVTDALPYANIFWRWLGVRAVPHLPCDTTCEPTAALGKELMEVGRRRGYAAEMDWLAEMLSWPVEWSACHGIGEVRSPILKLEMTTDSTPGTLRVRLPGSDYPPEGARGLAYPYSSDLARNAQLVHARQAREPTPECQTWYWHDNGFRSRESMEQAHAALVDGCMGIVMDCAAPTPRILDLGCGNGALLRSLREKLSMQGRDSVLYGIDSNPMSVAHSKRILVGDRATILRGDMFDRALPIWSDSLPFDVAILMPGRLSEVDVERRTAFLRALGSNARHIVCYCYSEWATNETHFEELIERSGLEFLHRLGVPRVALARVRAARGSES